MDSYRAPGDSHRPERAGADTTRQEDQAAPAGFVKRRLSDRIELAFEQACEQGQIEVAACMLKGLDLALLGRPTPWERRQAALVLLRTCAGRLEALRERQQAESGATLAVNAA